MSEWASTIIALIIGGLIGLFMGMVISADVTEDRIEFGGIAYKVERLNQ